MKLQFPYRPLNILLAVDGSEHSLAAAKLIRDLPLPANSNVTVVGVLTPRRTIGRAPLQTALEEACGILSSDNVDAISGLLHGHPAEQLIEFANEHKPDLVVVGELCQLLSRMAVQQASYGVNIIREKDRACFF